MANLNEYAQLASIVYTKTQTNRLPIPTAMGWTAAAPWVPDDHVTGFSAGAYRKGNEIVISYAGTNGEFGGVRDHLYANFPAANGVVSSHVMQAIYYYFYVRDANPDVPLENISFTGHSLGGGLASLMAIYFDKRATIFAPAPFQLSATTLDTFEFYYDEITGDGLSDPAFTEYFDSHGALYSTRQAKVEAHTIEGEVLVAEAGRFTTIVDPGKDHFYQTAGSDDYVDLHSMLLHAAIIRSRQSGGQFEQAMRTVKSATGELTLIPTLFDDSFYYTEAQFSDKPDFMHRLMQQEWGYTGDAVNSPIERFGRDLLQLAPTGAGLAQTTDVQKALVVAAMEYRYFKDTASATQLFTSTGNAIHFKYSDIGASSYKSLPLLALATGAQHGISANLKKQDAWHVQSGAGAMAWTATGADNDAVIGGTGSDYADAGAGNDILIGNEGNDQLFGGAGNDILIGGSGNDLLQGGSGYDVYYWKSGEGYDQLRDSTETGSDHGKLPLGPEHYPIPPQLRQPPGRRSDAASDAKK